MKKNYWLVPLGLISGCISWYFLQGSGTISRIEFSDYTPGVAFGLFVALFFWKGLIDSGKSKREASLRMIGFTIVSLVAWLIAYYGAMTTLGPDGILSALPFAVGMSIAGFVGAFIVMLGLPLLFPFKLSLKNALVIPLAGGLLTAISMVMPGGGFLALFLAWQGGVAAAIAYFSIERN